MPALDLVPFLAFLGIQYRYWIIIVIVVLVIVVLAYFTMGRRTGR